MEFAGHRTWYRVIPGDEGGDPLLVLHGGPAIPHDYLAALGRLAERGRTVVFYDQLGCGRSDRPDDPSLFTFDTFLAELDAVRDALGLSSVHLLGHSLGGVFALEHALRGARGLRSLVLASATPSVPLLVEEQLRLLERDQGADARATAERHTAAGTVDDPEFRAVVDAFFDQHMTNRRPWDDDLQRAFAGMGHDVYAAMWGTGGQFRPAGELAAWDVTARLGDIRVPTLLTHGRHDYVTVELGEVLERQMPEAQLVVFEDSGHLAFAEETERYLDVVERFLRGVERRAVVEHAHSH